MPCKKLVHNLTIGIARQRRVVGPTRLGRTGLHEEAHAHHDSTEKVDPEAGHIELGESHIRRANLQRCNVVSKSCETQRNDPKEDHDRSVHRTEHVVGLTSHLAVDQPTRFPAVGENPAHVARKGLMGIGDAPAHHDHQEEAEEQEGSCREAILDSDRLVIGGKKILLPPWQNMVVVVVVVIVGVLGIVGVRTHGSIMVGLLFTRMPLVRRCLDRPWSPVIKCHREASCHVIS